MKTRCTICTNPKVKTKVNAELLAGRHSVRKIAAMFSLSRRTLYRHKERCEINPQATTLDALDEAVDSAIAKAAGKNPQALAALIRSKLDLMRERQGLGAVDEAQAERARRPLSQEEAQAIRDIYGMDAASISANLRPLIGGPAQDGPKNAPGAVSRGERLLTRPFARGKKLPRRQPQPEPEPEEQRRESEVRMVPNRNPLLDKVM